VSRILMQAYRLHEDSTPGFRVVLEDRGRIEVLVPDYECGDLRAAAERCSELYGLPLVCTVEDAA
jgi:hypothetical protein